MGKRHKIPSNASEARSNASEARSNASEARSLKPSRYNSIFPLSSTIGSALLYNSRSNALLRVSEKVSDIVREVLEGRAGEQSLKESLISELRSGRFLVEEGLDEVAALKVMERRARFGGSKYSITIAPTLACNFRCHYCFQKHRNETMANGVTSKIKKFVGSLISDLGIKQLQVCWYGGEPLLAKDVLIELQRYLHQECTEKGVAYKSALITNGYLLDAGAAKTLSETGNDFVQITLDGPKESHDKRRVLTNGRPTFDRIYKNMKDVAVYFQEIKVRVNVDKENPDAFESVTEMLWQDGLIPKVQPYPGHVDALTPACERHSLKCMSLEEFATFEVRIGKNLIEKGRDYASYPSVAVGCGAICDNALVIDPEGILYKCWNDVGERTQSVGRLNDDSVDFNENLFKWIGYDLFGSEECRQCLFLPLCLGRCPYERIAKGNSENLCSPLRHNLEATVKLKYVNEMAIAMKEGA